MAESTDENNEFPHISFNCSTSFHSTAEGKVWTRLLIHLCWWLHDMFKFDNVDAKFNYIEEKITHCQNLFPGKFKLMFSDPCVSSAEQHPLLICREDEQKIIILVFRATVSSKSIQDVFTDANIFSDCNVYIGTRHAGFASRVETAPLIAVTNWLRQGWKIIITGHSLGGAVSQLFTAKVISRLIEAGLTSKMVSLRCITFGVPQCADYHFWSSYTDWYDVFDTYIYEYDAIFRLTTFGADAAKKVVDSFTSYLRKFETKICGIVISYTNEDLRSTLIKACDQIYDNIIDTLIPKYSIFGRHHFIRKDEKGEFKIDSVGEITDEKKRLVDNLVRGGCWYDYFIERKLVPDQFTFVYREFMEHGCYPFSINQLFNREAAARLGNMATVKPKVRRIEVMSNRIECNSASDQVINMSAFIYFPDEVNLCYIYFQGFLADLIVSVILPVELAECERSRKKTPTLSQDRPDECAVLCDKSDVSTKYLETHSSFKIDVTTYFGSFTVQVVILSNFDSTISSVYKLDPIQTVIRAYREFVLDANSIEQVDSPLSICFRLLLAAFQRIGQDKTDTIMARYFAEIECRNFRSNTVRHVLDLNMPQTEDAAKPYFSQVLISLEKTYNDLTFSEETRKNALFLHQALSREIQDNLSSLSLSTTNEAFPEHVRLVPLILDFVQLRQHLRDLHICHDVDQIRQTVRTVMAPFFFIIIKLKRLHSIERYTDMNKVGQFFRIFSFWERRRAARAAAEAGAAAVAGGAAMGGAAAATGGAAAAVGGAAAATGGAAMGGVAMGGVVMGSASSLAMGGAAAATGGAAMGGVVIGSASSLAMGGAAMGSTSGLMIGGASFLGMGSASSLAMGGAAMGSVSGFVTGGAAAAEVAAVGAVGSAAAGGAAVATMAVAAPALVAGVGVGFFYHGWSSWKHRQQLFGDYEQVIKSLIENAALLLASTGSDEALLKKEDDWQILDQIIGCHWSRQLTEAKSIEERDDIWVQTFTREPLKGISPDDRWNFVGVTGLCSQLWAMRQILLRQPQKIVILGRSQMGKSTLFQYLTGREPEELRNVALNNTRMSLKYRAFIKLNQNASSSVSNNCLLPVDVVDNPGFDDASGLFQCWLEMCIDTANIVIIVSTLDDLNLQPSIELLSDILKRSRVKILVLINQVDVRLRKEWENFKGRNSNKEDSDDEDDSTYNMSVKEFKLCSTLDEIKKEKLEELIDGLERLQSTREEVDNRVKFQTIILKGFNEFNKTFNEPSFRDKVHKSNVKMWLIQNLVNCQDRDHSV